MKSFGIISKIVTCSQGGSPKPCADLFVLSTSSSEPPSVPRRVRCSASVGSCDFISLTIDETVCSNIANDYGILYYSLDPSEGV